ncbi:MAG TPA: mechanosensitive ion channel family protein [Actinomycetales bacterium]|nr:mechanosensitive ion channel family protein [Actinomycetales bacterium]
MPSLFSTPEPSPSVTGDSISDQAERACADVGVSICTVVTDVTGSEVAGKWTEVLLGTPLKILLIVVVGVVLRFVLHKLIDRVVKRLVAGGSARERSWQARRAAAILESSSPLAAERRVQRAQTMGSVLRSVTTGVVAVVILLMILAELGLNIAPLLASAGILGVALGFGSQALVKDFLSGIFMIAEDQYGVGDVVDLGEAVGSVEAVGLRVTRLRSVDGTVWYVRNGEILRVGNQSQGWARAVLDIGVGYGEDVSRVQDLLREVGADLTSDPEWGELVMEDPEVWGVEALSADSVVVRLVVKTVPLEQWRVARELRRRIKASFDANDVEIPFPQRTVWMRHEADQPRPTDPGAQARHESPPQSEAVVVTDAEPDEDRRGT